MATNHVYTDRTLKLLFGTASSCAHPTCTQPVIHLDRGLLTPVAEIAHIRSRSPLGPRYDASYESEKIDSFENLLLLCPAHHHVVDYHHGAYPTAELLEWKAAQVGDCLPGLSDPVDMAQLVSHMQDLFARMPTDDLQALADGRVTLRLIDRAHRSELGDRSGEDAARRNRLPHDDPSRANDAVRVASLSFPLDASHAVLPKGQKCRQVNCRCQQRPV